MSDGFQQPSDFAAVKTRLAEIADAVADEDLSLDAALDLYEEAVALGLQASDLLEVGISPEEESEESASGESALADGESADGSASGPAALADSANDNSHDQA